MHWTGLSVHIADSPILEKEISEYEMFRSMWKFDYQYFNNGSIEFEQYKIISIDILFRMKVFVMDAGEKH